MNMNSDESTKGFEIKIFLTKLWQFFKNFSPKGDMAICTTFPRLLLKMLSCF
jgi:hypothetical protein